MTADTADRSLAGIAEERNELWADAHRAKVLEHEAARLRALLAAREASLSWRMTAPLRRVTARLRPRGRRQGRRTPTPNDTSSARRA
jgi:hypothetical protein